MAADRFTDNLRSRLDSVADPGERFKLIAENVAEFFAVRSHEVGIFTVNRKKHEINFVWPQGMANVGHIPLNAVNSLVAKTANSLESTVDNNFARSRHLFMFEFMLAEKSDRIPVQKIMSVPVRADGAAVAVIQVVRKGAAPLEAGADFSGEDVAALETIAATLAQSGLGA